MRRGVAMAALGPPWPHVGLGLVIVFFTLSFTNISLARKEDYERSAPKKSFIHVDDFDGPEHLAEYLHKLDRDDNLYNEYFQWKGTGEMINTKFFCRVCSLLHDEQRREEAATYYKDINQWWRGKGTCVKSSWRSTPVKTNKNNSTL